MSWEHSRTNRGSPEHSHCCTAPGIHFTGTIKAPLNSNGLQSKTAACACLCCQQQDGSRGFTSLSLWGRGAAVSAESPDRCLSRRPRGCGMPALLPHRYLLGPTSPASQHPRCQAGRARPAPRQSSSSTSTAGTLADRGLRAALTCLCYRTVIPTGLGRKRCNVLQWHL